VIGALRTAAANFRARRGMFLASGLAFNFIVGLIPLLFFVVSVAGFVLSRRTVMEAVLGQLSAIVPVYKSELHDTLAAIIRRRRLSSLLGTAVLLLFASQLFNSIRLVLSDIFGFRGGPGFLRGLLRDVVMVVAMGLLFLGSLVISDVFGWLKILLFETMGVPSPWTRSWSLALALTLSTLFFFVPYRCFPSPRPASLVAPSSPRCCGGRQAALPAGTSSPSGSTTQVYGPLGVLVRWPRSPTTASSSSSARVRGRADADQPRLICATVMRSWPTLYARPCTGCGSSSWPT
jgi:hypothetical protein